MRVSFSVNGSREQIDVEPRRTLADALRDDLGLTGTHLGCEQGVCGACTVLLDGELHPLQQAFAECHGLQCGFCTPGFLISALHLLAENPDPSREQIREGLSGNICRCTGYVGIVDAVRRAAAAARQRNH